MKFVRVGAFKVLVFAAVLSAGFTARAASSECANELLVDCDEFKVMSTICPIYSAESGRLVGATQSYSAVFADQNTYPLVREKKKRSEDDVYSAVLDSTAKLYVVVSAKKGVNQNIELTYSAYTVAWNKKSDSKICPAISTK